MQPCNSRLAGKKGKLVKIYLGPAARLDILETFVMNGVKKVPWDLYSLTRTSVDKEI